MKPLKIIMTTLFMVIGTAFLAKNAAEDVLAHEHSPTTIVFQKEDTYLFIQELNSCQDPIAISYKEQIHNIFSDYYRSHSKTDYQQALRLLADAPHNVELSARNLTETLKTEQQTYLAEKAAAEKAAAEKAAAEKAAAEKAAAEKAAVEKAAAEKVAAEKAAAEKAAVEKAAAEKAAAEKAAAENTSAEKLAAAVPEERPSTISFSGITLPLENCQGAAEAPYRSVAGIWNGSGSTTDGAPTHFIGHNPGAFSALFGLGCGSSITVTDYNGNSRTYIVSTILEVNDDALDHSGRDRWNDIIYQSGESISLQTCIDDYWNLMVLAH